MRVWGFGDDVDCEPVRAVTESGDEVGCVVEEVEMPRGDWVLAR